MIRLVSVTDHRGIAGNYKPDELAHIFQSHYLQNGNGWELRWLLAVHYWMIGTQPRSASAGQLLATVWWKDTSGAG